MITPTTPITVPNRLYRAGKSFKDFEDHGVEHLTYAGTLAKSSNIGTIKAAERLGNLKRLYPYLAEVRHRPAHRPRPAGRGRRRAAAAGGLVGDQRLHDGVRPGLLRQHGADGVGVRDHRQRRGAGAAAAGRRRPPAPTAAIGPDAGSPAARRVVSTHDRADGALDARRRSPADGGTAPLAADPRLPRRWQDRHRAAVRPDVRLLPRLHHVVHRDGPGRQARAGRRGHAAGAQGRRSAAACNAGPVFKEVMSFALEALRIPPTGTKPGTGSISCGRPRQLTA